MGMDATDKNLLSEAALAYGNPVVDWILDGNSVPVAVLQSGTRWQPVHENQITDCMGDALRLAVKLDLLIEGKYSRHMEVREYMDDRFAATRRAIVRAAASIGSGKESAS